MKDLRLVEQYDTMTEVLHYITKAKGLYATLNRPFSIDYSFVDTENGLRYKVTIIIKCNDEKSK